jgi:predicted transposase YdaD
LGKGRVQEQAIKEVAALPVAHPQRDNVLELLGNLKVILEARVTIEPEERELIMQLSPLYLEKIQAAESLGERRGRQSGLLEGAQQGEVKEAQTLILRLLKRRVGNVSELEARIKRLPLAQLEELGESLLDFSQMSDLVAWLDSAIDI